jgi:WD40 repeat protein
LFLGDLVVTAGADATIKVWEVQNAAGLLPTGLLLAEAAAGEEVAALAPLSSARNTDRFASLRRDGELTFWDWHARARQLARVGSAHVSVGDEEAIALAVTSNGDRLAVGTSRGRIVLLPRDESEGIDLSRATRLPGHTRPVLDLAFRPDGKLLASASDDGMLRLWDISDDDARPFNTPVRSAGPELTSLAFSPDGQWLAAADTDRKVTLYPGSTAEWVRVACEMAASSGTLDHSAYTRIAEERNICSDR